MSTITTYVREARQELQKVIWPGKQQIIQHTLLVFGVSAGIAIFIGGVDYLFTFGFEQFLRLRS
ncbi:preprotein translocase subunit SecE [Candidatus Uhrbacteria bacterium]|nr:preprotein translocase subunit SecE [Candidatus Uhrbacteria bacterium]